jgi:mevalonate kinase
VEVPGSLMLLGEHAVLYKKQAIVVAINRYLKVNLIPRSDRNLFIVSQEFGNQLIVLDKFKIVKPYNYVLTVIDQYLSKIKTGFTLKISSNFSHNLGFGSSAAVTVATLGVLYWFLYNKKMDLMKLYRKAVKVIRLVQGLGSGADVAASVFGGVLSYQMQPPIIKRLRDNLPIVAVYSGSKLTTSDVITRIEPQIKQLPNIFAKLYDVMGECTKSGVAAIKSNQWFKLGKLMNIYQGLQESLGVNNAILAELVFSLRKSKNIYGAKISGSGLGDSVIGLGQIKRKYFPINIIQRQIGVRQIDIKVSSKGLVYF